MIPPDLHALETFTRDYAAFQSRKSGLATALGGLMAAALAPAAFSPAFMGLRVGNHLLVEGLVWIPFLWVGMKVLAGHLVYRGLGTVKAAPDDACERRRWQWILGLGLFLMAATLAALLAFVLGHLQAAPPSEALAPFPLWILAMPLLYFAAMPWSVRGVEEARVYAVLAGQCVLWLIPAFLLAFGSRGGWGRFGDLAGLGVAALALGVLAWGALAMVRGWREHREYVALLRSLPEKS